MKGAVRDRNAMIAGMQPRLRDAPVAYATARMTAGAAAGAGAGALPLAADDPRLIALVREEEGLTLVLPHAEALALGLEVHLVAAQITLTVHSALDGVGLTAAAAGALADAGIACNVVAGAFHDHLFVPWADRAAAMAALTRAAAGA